MPFIMLHKNFLPEPNPLGGVLYGEKAFRQSEGLGLARSHLKSVYLKIYSAT